jgi:hypothetical protein
LKINGRICRICEQPVTQYDVACQDEDGSVVHGECGRQEGREMAAVEIARLDAVQFPKNAANRP